MVRQKSHKISQPALGQVEAFPSPLREIFQNGVVLWIFCLNIVKLLNQLMSYRHNSSTQILKLLPCL